MGIAGEAYQELVELADGLGLSRDFEQAFEVGYAVKREINRLRKLAGEPEPFEVDDTPKGPIEAPKNAKDLSQVARFKADPSWATSKDVRWLCLRLEAYIEALAERDAPSEQKSEG